MRNIHKINQQIYITNDESAYPYALHLKNQEVLKIKAVGENSGELYHDKGFSYPKDCKKIILTTDQDLIEDGVQAIDNEFLEWFVKNPSCERVDWCYSSLMKDYEYEITIPRTTQQIIDEDFDGGLTMGQIIPKEETNQVGIDWSGFPKSTQEKIGYVEPEQETLEEAVQKVANSDDFINGALFGSQWQKERMYSEEEIIKILIEYDYSKINDDKLNSVGIVKKWFKQFKKK